MGKPRGPALEAVRRDSSGRNWYWLGAVKRLDAPTMLVSSRGFTTGIDPLRSWFGLASWVP